MAISKITSARALLFSSKGPVVPCLLFRPLSPDAKMSDSGQVRATESPDAGARLSPQESSTSSAGRQSTSSGGRRKTMARTVVSAPNAARLGNPVESLEDTHPSVRLVGMIAAWRAVGSIEHNVCVPALSSSSPPRCPRSRPGGNPGAIRWFC